MAVNYWNQENLKKENIGWMFPAGNGGEIEGFNDAKQDNFRRKLESLTREIIQNSLDAVDDPSKPVHVEFSFRQYKTNEIFPFKDEFKQRLEACRNSPSNKTKIVIDKASETLDRNNLAILKVSDFNTVGLTDPLGQDPRTSSFISLLKGSGVSAKSGNTGGSFGLGKTAPFTCSDIRTVFYFTQNKHGDRAFQGKSILATHEWVINGKRCQTRSVGYFGNCDDKLTPVTGRMCDQLPEFFTKRAEVGTDIFVLGLSPSECSAWDEKIRNSILLNFFVAIKRGTLSCTVSSLGNTPLEINKGTIDDLILTLSEDIEDAERISPHSVPEHVKDIVRFYNAYSIGQQSKKDAGRLAGSELYILPSDQCPDHLYSSSFNSRSVRVLNVRRQGMKIEEKQFDHAISAYVVFIALGEKLDRILQRCEPPAHNKWILPKTDEMLKTDREEARACLNEISTWIRDSVNALIPEGGEEIDAGVGEFLPCKEDPILEEKSIPMRSNPSQRPNANSRPRGRGIRSEEGEESMEPAALIRKDQPEPHAEIISEAPGAPASENPAGEDGGSTPNPQTPNDTDGGEPKMGDSRNPLSPDDEGKGLLPQTPDRHGPSDKKTKSRRTVDFYNFRCAASKEAGEYIVMFSPEADIENGKLRATIVGETENFDTEIKFADLMSDEGEATCRNSFVLLKNIPANSRIRLRIRIPYAERVALSISVEDETYE